MFYVNNNLAACSDTTTDSATAPYCSIQAAVNQAVIPGDTVVVFPGPNRYAPFTVSASGTSAAPITIVNALREHFATAYNTIVNVKSFAATPALTVNGASYADIEGLSLNSTQTVVDVTGSASHITLDSNRIELTGTASSEPTVVIDGGTSSITMSRNWVGSLAQDTAEIAATGSSSDVFTTNEVEGAARGPGILLSGTTNSDVTGNTVAVSCGSKVSVVDGSTGASVENNIISDLVPQAVGCSVPDTDAAALKVDAASVAETSADYNDVYLNPPSNSQMADYSWAGTRYGSASGQAVHDTNAGSAAAVDSANSAAPGELSTDLYGRQLQHSAGADG